MMSLGGRKCHFDIAFDNTLVQRERLVSNRLCDLRAGCSMLYALAKFLQSTSLVCRMRILIGRFFGGLFCAQQILL